MFPLFLFVFASLFFSLLPSVYAVTIHLSDGSTVEGKIVEKTAKSIKVNVNGIEMVYFPDEVWDIDGVPFVTKKNNNPAKALPDVDGQYHQIFKEATDAFVKGDYVQSENLSQQAIDIDPKPESYNNLAIAQYDQGKYQQAAANYNIAVSLGLKPDPATEKALRPYRYREFSVKSPYGPEIPFKGKTNCSDQEIHNILRTVLSKLDDPKDLLLIKPQFTEFSKNGKDFDEQWVVQTKSTVKTFTIYLKPTVENNADYDVTENINDQQISQFGNLSNNPGSALYGSSNAQQLSSAGSIFIDGRQWDADRYYEEKNARSIRLSAHDGSSEELIYGEQHFSVDLIVNERDLLAIWSTAIWHSLKPECSNLSGSLIKDANPKYIIAYTQCVDLPNHYQIARFEADKDTGTLLMLMYRVDTPPASEIKNKWAQNLDAYELIDNLDLKNILQKIKDQQNAH